MKARQWSIGSVALVVSLVGLLLLGVLALAARATAPPSHKVTICHAHPADSLTGPWVEITADVASVGYQQSGHQDEHDGDIIPPWEYTDAEGGVFSYPGKGDQAILENGCVALNPSPSPTESPSPSPSETGSPSPTTSPPVVTTQPPPPDKHTAKPPKNTAYTGFNGKAAAGAGILLAAGLGCLWYARKLKV